MATFDYIRTSRDQEAGHPGSALEVQRRGVRLSSLASNERKWAKFLDADPDSPEAFMRNILARIAAHAESQKSRSISHRTRVILDADKAKWKDLGRPQLVAEEQSPRSARTWLTRFPWSR